MATCRDCALWNKTDAMDKIGRILKNRSAKCLWVPTDVYPASVGRFTNNIRPIVGFMMSEEGSGCGQFVKIDEEVKK